MRYTIVNRMVEEWDPSGERREHQGFTFHLNIPGCLVSHILASWRIGISPKPRHYALTFQRFLPSFFHKFGIDSSVGACNHCETDDQTFARHGCPASASPALIVSGCRYRVSMGGFISGLQ